jgi:hypothetical protein
MVLGGAIAGAAGLAWPRHQTRGRVVIQRGVFGGGLAQVEGGGANFSISASRLIFPDENREVVVGSMTWNDLAAEIELLGTHVTGYERLELPAEQGQGRRITGIAATGDLTEYPFVLDVVDGGPPGSGLDTVALTVGDAVEIGIAATPAIGFGFSYAASGPVLTGDIRAVDVEIDIESGSVSPAPPPA